MLAATDLTIGFLVQAYVLVSVGVGAQTDAYYAGQAAPAVLLAILQLPMQRAIVVAFATKEEARFPAIRVIAGVGGFAAVVLMILWSGGPWMMRLLYPEFREATLQLSVHVLRVQGIAVLFSSVNLVLLSLNQLHNRFTRCELVVLLSTLVAAVFTYVAVDEIGVIAAAYGQVIKSAVTTVFFLWMLRGSLSSAPAPWAQISLILKPLVSAGFLTKLAPLIDRSIAAGAASGSMSVFVFAQAIYNAATGIAERAIVAPRLPGLRRDSDFKSVMRIAAILAGAGVGLVILLASGSAILAQVPAVYRMVGGDRLNMLTTTLIALAGLPVAALTLQWTAAAVVVLGRPDLSAKISLGFIVGIAIRYAAFRIAGIPGLAVGVSIYFLLVALAFYLVLRSIMQRDRRRE
jgi:O-antigen/teichoic acid export membrane protein